MSKARKRVVNEKASRNHGSCHLLVGDSWMMIFNTFSRRSHMTTSCVELVATPVFAVLLSDPFYLQRIVFDNDMERQERNYIH